MAKYLSHDGLLYLLPKLNEKWGGGNSLSQVILPKTESEDPQYFLELKDGGGNEYMNHWAGIVSGVATSNTASPGVYLVTASIRLSECECRIFELSPMEEATSELVPNITNKFYFGRIYTMNNTYRICIGGFSPSSEITITQLSKQEVKPGIIVFDRLSYNQSGEKYVSDSNKQKIYKIPWTLLS